MSYLFWTFVKFGLLCVGGGYMLIPLLIAEFVGDNKILSAERFTNLVAIAQMTPGPVGINTATYVGFLQRSYPGAAVATLAMVLPSLVLIYTTTTFLKRFRSHWAVNGLLAGAKLASTALIIYAVLVFAGMSFFQPAVSIKELPSLLCGRHRIPALTFSLPGFGITLLAFTAVHFFKLKTTWVILGSGLLGALLYPICF